MTNQVLLTVSGEIDFAAVAAQTARGERPEADYLAMSRAFDADLLDYGAARQQTGRIGRLIERLLGHNALLAWACFRLRRRYRVIFSDGEQIGIPLAILLKFFGGRPRPRHLMIGHILSVGKKMLLLDLFRLHSHIDRFFVYSTWQKNFIEKRWGVPAERVIFTPFMVDADFFAAAPGLELDPALARNPAQALICAVGLEFRDYPTLIEAARGLDVHLVIAAASPWSKRADSTAGQAIPANVSVRRFSQYELRALYAASEFLVMPLYPVNFQAGVTAILEAMAMGKAVICTRTPGQSDVIEQGETGLYVPPGDSQALREAIQWLLDHPDEARRMGANGRQRVETTLSLARYVARLQETVARECQPGRDSQS